MDLTIIAVFHNMQREAPRTLHSLSRNYQHGVASLDYEVVCLDHGSTFPLSANEISAFGENFFYRFIDTKQASPCQAINEAALLANGKYLMICIDGARILSPGILANIMQATTAYTNPMIFSLNAHLGPAKQFLSIPNGYTKQQEDDMLESIQWKEDGYRLFSISSLGGSATGGIIEVPSETNTLCLEKQQFVAMGGYNENFISNGGGLANLEIFSRLISSPITTPILITGEATFHQQHGGTITNTFGKAREDAFQIVNEEYESIMGRPYTKPNCDYIQHGKETPLWRDFIKGDSFTLSI